MSRNWTHAHRIFLGFNLIPTEVTHPVVPYREAFGLGMWRDGGRQGER